MAFYVACATDIQHMTVAQNPSKLNLSFWLGVLWAIGAADFYKLFLTHHLGKINDLEQIDLHTMILGGLTEVLSKTVSRAAVVNHADIEIGVRHPCGILNLRLFTA